MRDFRQFIRDEAGAVTVDWVTVTAGVLLLAIVVVVGIYNNGVSHLVSDVNSTLDQSSTAVPLGAADDLGG